MVHPHRGIPLSKKNEQTVDMHNYLDDLKGITLSEKSQSLTTQFT